MLWVNGPFRKSIPFYILYWKISLVYLISLIKIIYAWYIQQWWFDRHIHIEITTTVKLVNISSHVGTFSFSFLVMRASEIYSLSKLPVFNIALLTRVNMWYIRSLGDARSYSSYKTATLYPLNNMSLFLPPPTSGYHHSILCFYVFHSF